MTHVCKFYLSSSFDFLPQPFKNAQPSLACCLYIQKIGGGPDLVCSYCWLTHALSLFFKSTSSSLKQSSVILETCWVFIFSPNPSPLSCLTFSPPRQKFKSSGHLGLCSSLLFPALWLVFLGLLSYLFRLQNCWNAKG